MWKLPISCLLIFWIGSPADVEAQSHDSGKPTSHEVVFSNGSIQLAATLLVPSGQGPFPGVVLVHGSGSSSRSNPWTSAYATALVQRGIAVLHPDKRGSGNSEGDWHNATFVDLADDAIAAVSVLRKYPSVDSLRIGLIGFSQGGQIIPLAATRSNAVSFVASISGSVVPMMEQVNDEIRQMAEREGLDENDQQTVLSIQNMAVDYALTGQGWDTYTRALEKASRTPLGNTDVLKGFPGKNDDPVWAFLRTIGNFDPMPYWRRLQVPALFVFGGRDENVDVYKSADLIEELLTPTDVAYSLLLFRNNGHGLYREDAMDFIARWIKDAGMD